MSLPACNFCRNEPTECSEEIVRLRAQRDKLLEACEDGVKTLKLALAAIDGACGIPKERRKPCPIVLEMERAIAAGKEKP